MAGYYVPPPLVWPTGPCALVQHEWTRSDMTHPKDGDLCDCGKQAWPHWQYSVRLNVKDVKEKK